MRAPGDPLDYRNSPAHPAHILFTSGSTGTPKGVVIPHSNVIHFVEWARRYFNLGPTDRVSGHPPLHFDLSTFDVFGTFASGAQLHLVRSEEHTSELQSRLHLVCRLLLEKKKKIYFTSLTRYKQ